MNRPIGQYQRPQKASGFTLLEMVIVLGMITVIVTWVTLSIAAKETEQKLRDSSADIVTLVKQARSIAITQQRAYQVTISADSLGLAPQYMLASYDDVDDFRDRDDESDESPRANFEDVTDSVATDTEVTYEIKRWRSDDWILLEDNTKVVLTVDPVGLVEPISIRCSIGDSYLIQELHPLTADVRDEEMSVDEE